MALETRHIIVWINCPAFDVYQFASNPENLPSWASGLGQTVENVDGSWMVDSPMGRVEVSFVGSNSLGVLDHRVTLPSGESFCNAMRVLPDDEGSEVVFTLRRRDGQSYEEFCADVEAVEADLERLKHTLEAA